MKLKSFAPTHFRTTVALTANPFHIHPHLSLSSVCTFTVIALMAICSNDFLCEFVQKAMHCFISWLKNLYDFFSICATVMGVMAVGTHVLRIVKI